MKIYIVTKEGFPHGMAAVKRILNYTKAWQSCGIVCEILIYTRTEKYGRKPNNTDGDGVYDGVSYQYMKGTPLRESNVFLRKLNDYLDRLRLKKYLLYHLNKGDIVYAYNGYDDYSYAILKIAHSKGAAYAVELCELPFGTSEETPRKVRKRKAYEKKVLPFVDGVIAISDALVEYAKEHCSPKIQVAKIPILVDFPKYEMNDRSDEEDVPYIFHSGTLFQQKDGFLDMLRAFGIASRRLPFDVRFISTGIPKGSRHEKEINEIIKEYDMGNKVVFTGYLSEPELQEYLAKAAFVVINKLTTKQNKYCFSTKLGEYMAAQKAIVITRVGEAMNYLDHGQDSYIIEPNDICVLSAAMEKMFLDTNLRKVLGVNAQKCCEKNFSVTNNAMKLGKLMKDICSSQNKMS